MAASPPARSRGPRHGLGPPRLAAWGLVLTLGACGNSGAWYERNRGGTTIEAFSDPGAVYPGDSVPVYVRTAASELTLRLLRIGAYGARDSRLTLLRSGIPATPQPPCTAGPDHLLDCANWKATFHLTIGHWRSGVYVLQLSTRDGGETLVPLVVGSRTPTPYLASIGVFTFEAYNTWGGHSLYGYNSDGKVAAYRVSFRRPYAIDALLRSNLGGYDAPILRWLDRAYGAKVSYETDFELAAAPVDPAVRALVLVGHDEYMTQDERAHLAAAIDAGHPNLAVLGANDAYWQARLEAAPDGTPLTELVCYRDAKRDPVADRSRVTIRWRDLGKPANALFGIAYSGLDTGGGREPEIVATASDPLFAGTGAHDAEHIGDYVGYEADGILHNGHTPAGIRVLTRGPYPNYSGTAVSNATFYVAPSGTRVFAAGSMEWGFGLDADGKIPHSPSPIVTRLTRNALDALGR